MGISKIQTVGRRPLNMIVYENIKKAIMEGEIKPGTRLTETKVGQQMNVSTTPVREAFRKLESERLVKIIPYRGAVVQEFSSREIKEVYQCRESLESLSIELSIDHIDEKGIQKLQDLIEQFKGTENFTEYAHISLKIHNLILEYAQNDTLGRLLEQINDVVYHNRSVSSYSEHRREQIYKEHVQILEAIKARDKDKATKSMKQHIQNGYKYIKDRLDNA